MSRHVVGREFLTGIIWLTLLAVNVLAAPAAGNSLVQVTAEPVRGPRHGRRRSLSGRRLMRRRPRSPVQRVSAERPVPPPTRVVGQLDDETLANCRRVRGLSCRRLPLERHRSAGMLVGIRTPQTSTRALTVRTRRCSGTPHQCNSGQRTRVVFGSMRSE